MGRLWLIGMMGAGKTEAGRRAAEMLGVPFVDTDREVEAALGGSVAELWERCGEQAFRDAEAEQVAAAAAGPGAVIATGGGVVLRESNVAAMRASGAVVWLEAPPEMLSARIDDGAGRPLLGTGTDFERLFQLLAERAERYGGAADRSIETSGLSADEVAERVAELWNDC